MRLQPIAKTILFSFSFLFISTFSLFSERVPDWVLSAPASSDYYIGIGSAHSGNRAEDYQAALEKAKANLAADISVQIVMDRETKLFFTNEQQSAQKNNRVSGASHSESAKEMIQVEEKILQQVEAFLKDIEVVKSWYSKKEGYWIYVRLKKSLYEQNRQKEMARVRNRVYQILEPAGDPKGDSLYFQFGRMLKGYQVLSESFFADQVMGKINGEEGLLADLLDSHLRNLLQSLQLKVDAPKTLQWGQPFPLECQLVAPLASVGAFKMTLYQKVGATLSSPLFQFQFSSEGMLSKKIELGVLKQVGQQHLFFQLDLSEFEESLSLFNPPLVAPSAEIEFSFEVPLVGLKVIHHESALKKELGSSVVALLAEKGVPFQFDLKKTQPTQLLFELDFTELPKYMEGQPLIVRGEVVISLQKEGKELFSYEVASVKAAGTTLAQAKQNAWRALQKNFQKDDHFIEKLILAFQ